MAPTVLRPLVLCAGSMVRFGFVDTIDAAAAARFDGISVWKRTCRRAREREGIDLDTMRRLLDERGLVVSQVEGTSGWLPGWSPSSPDDLGFDEGLDYAHALGARSVLAFVDAPAAEPGILVDAFGRACDRARDRDLDVALEFLPWGAVPSLADALRVVRAAARPNGRIVFDTWHHARSGATALPVDLDPALIGFIQLADGPARPEEDDLVHETMFRRRPPGDGDFGITGTLATLVRLGADCPVGVEVYDQRLADLPARELAATLATASRRVLPAGS
jgi:sugar phosphate isomerase/epimerase